MGRDDPRMARPYRSAADQDARRKADRDLSGDLYGRHLQELCCGACAVPREAVIGFPAHGPRRVVEKAIAARDVPVGQSWAFREHRTMAQVIAAEKFVTA